MLHTWLQINYEIIIGIFIIHAFFHININSIYGIDNTFKTFKINNHIMMNPHTQEIFYCFLSQLVPPKCKSMINLIPTFTRNSYSSIARNREYCDLFCFRIEHDHHQSIGTTLIRVALIYPHYHYISSPRQQVI